MWLRTLAIAARFLSEHPVVRRAPLRAAISIARWQAASRLWGGELSVGGIGKTRLVVQRGMSGATGNVYAGLQEFAEMGFLLHFLRRNEAFADVGANAGTFSVLAGGVVGARVTAVEPIALAYGRLVRNLGLNGLHDVSALNVAAGAESSEARFTADLDAVNRALGSNEFYDGATVVVPVRPLDEILANTPTMMKIDVEGFEDAVVRGAARTLADHRLRAFIIEVLHEAPSELLAGETVPRFLIALGWQPCRYDPVTRTLARDDRPILDGNLLFVRDFDEAQGRLRSAVAFEVFGIDV